MRSSAFTFAWLLGALLGSAAWQPVRAQIQRCQTPQGHTIYSDAPCPTNASGSPVKLHDNRADPPPAPRPQAAKPVQPPARTRRPGNSPNAPADQRHTAACQLAIRNANVYGMNTPAHELQAIRTQAVQTCGGYNPWAETGKPQRRSKRP